MSFEVNNNKYFFEKIDDYPDVFFGANIHYCCLGTTRGKTGAEGFHRVDFDYIVGAARLAKQVGCKHFHLLLSQSADAHSLFLYPKVKKMPYLKCHLNVYQYIGQHKMIMLDCLEHHPFESLARVIVRNTVQRFAPEWIKTPIEVLARAMCFNTFTKNRPSIEILDNHAIFRLAEQQPFITKEQTNTANEH
ncbi:unnamed protein product [Rotaria sp. Silwood1]|nr:unnamed protein product [Rotaria sp. Silwood1]